jgi:hypothetical protein
MEQQQQTEALEERVSHLSYLLEDINKRSHEEVAELRRRVVALKDASDAETSIAELLAMRDQMNSISFTLQESEAAYNRMRLNSEHFYKESERRLIEKLSDAMPVNRAEVKAKLTTLEIRKIHIDASALYEDFKGLRFVVKESVEGLQQRIAVLRREEELSRMRESSHA